MQLLCVPGQSMRSIPPVCSDPSGNLHTVDAGSRLTRTGLVDDQYRALKDPQSASCRAGLIWRRFEDNYQPVSSECWPVHDMEACSAAAELTRFEDFTVGRVMSTLKAHCSSL